MKLFTVILAAGKGTRMKSDLPKVVHKIDNRELVNYVIDQAEAVDSSETYLVVGYKKDIVIDATSDRGVSYVEQKEQLGTGHAVMMAEESLKDKDGAVLILCGDVPLLRSETLNKLKETHEKENAFATVLTTKVENPFGYGRIIKDADGNIEKIVEQKDANEEEKKVDEINSGVYLIDCKSLFGALKNISSNNAQNEYYLTDVIAILKSEGKKVTTYLTEDYTEIYGINTLEQLKEAEEVILSRK